MTAHPSTFDHRPSTRTRPFRIADLFCGAGGTSTGAIEAAELCGYTPQLTGINHWDVAVATHTANHPGHPTPLCTNVNDVNPRTLFAPAWETETVDRPHLDLLWASPECTHHSIARGGKPINEQSRATAMCVPRWGEALLPSIILVENVPEFESWGPPKRVRRGGKMEWIPDPDLKGELFHAWLNLLRAAGYRAQWKVLCAADYGDPTTRERLFIYAVRGNRKIVWPDPTHVAKPEGNILFARRKPYVAARSFIDWSLKGESIFTKKRPLVVKTIRRILTGLEREVGGPFIVPARGGAPARSVNRPLQTITCDDRGVALIESALILDHPRTKGSGVRSANAPLPTVTASSSDFALVQPSFILEHRGTSDRHIEASARSLDEPLSAVATSGAHHAKVDAAFLIHSAHGAKDAKDNRTRSLDDPAPTIAGNRGDLALLETTFLVQCSHGNGPMGDRGDQRRVKSLDNPMPGLTGSNEWSKADAAFLIPNFGEAAGQRPRVHPVDQPAPAVTSHGAGALVTTALLGQQSEAVARNVNDPAPTVATGGAIGKVDYVITIDQQSSPNGVQSLDQGLTTVTTKQRHSLVSAEFLISYYGTGTSTAVAQPAPSVTTKDRFALTRATAPIVEIDGRTFRRTTYPAWKRLILRQATFRRRLTRLYLLQPSASPATDLRMLEITHRMLQVPELAAAQGFRRDYRFTGTKTQQVKQIGNAVPRRLARAIVTAAITQKSDVSWLPED